jgi:flavorubredoxin
VPKQSIKDLRRLQCIALQTSWLNFKISLSYHSRCICVEMKAIVIYHTRFGNTERIAKSIATGLNKDPSGIQDVVCTNLRDIVAVDESLKEYDMICIGAPTEGFSAPKPVKEFLRKLKSFNLEGMYGFAFDTKVDFRLSGSAAKSIEKELRSQGL